MALADTNKVDLYYNKEATWGETPVTPRMTQVRYTGESLSYTKESVMSEVIRSDRMRDQVALVGFTTEGDVNYEMAALSFDDFIEGALSSTWVNITTLGPGVTFSMAAADNSINDSGNGFAVIPVGAQIYVSGFATVNNNGVFTVVTVAAGKLTLSGGTVSNESAGPSVTIGSSGRRGATGDIDTTSPSTISTTSLNLTTLGLVVGQKFKTKGFGTAANNGVFTIASIATNAITVVETTIVTENNAGTVDLFGRRLRNGTTARSFHIEKQFTDITQFQSFQGLRIGRWSKTMTAMEIITGAFTIMGKQAVTAGATVSGSTVPANPTAVMTASANVGNITRNGTALATSLRSIAMNVENNLRAQSAVGSIPKVGIGYGFLDVTGTIEAYFEDLTLYNDLINHTTLSLTWRMTDTAGNIYVVTLPKVYFMTGSPNAGSGNADVMLPLEYTAVRDATTNCEIQLDFVSA